VLDFAVGTIQQRSYSGKATEFFFRIHTASHKIFTMADVTNRVQEVAKEEASKVSAMTRDAVQSRAYLVGQV